MAFSLSYRRLVEAVLAVVATAAMFYFGNGLETWWPLMWFALRSKWWTAAVTAVAVMMLGNLKHLELLYEDAGDAGGCVGEHLLGCWCRLCSGSTAVSRAGIARRGAERGSCFAGGLGDERVCAECNVATWVGRKSCVFAAEISPVSAAGFDHGALRDDLCVTAVSCCDCDCAAPQTALMEARVAGCWRGSWRGGGRAAVWCAAAVAAAEADGKNGTDHLRREAQ